MEELRTHKFMLLEESKYNFGFTAASLRLSDFVLVAKHNREGIDFDYVNILGSGKTTTGKRMFNEYSKRLATLTREQIDVLLNGTLSSQKQVAFLAVCKTNGFIRDFTIEVVREKMLLFDYQISEGEFFTFLRRKTESHPELESVTENTTNKIRQVTFKILEQAGIIDSVKNKIIQPQLIEPDVVSVIANDNKEWLKVLLMSDSDINNIHV